MVLRARSHLITAALSGLTSLLVAGGLTPLAPPQRAALAQQEPLRAAAVASWMDTHKTQLGLGQADGFAESSRFTDEFGKTHVRFHQTHQGVRVWDSAAIGHIDGTGQVETPQASVEKDIQLTGAPVITEALAREIVARDLAEMYQGSGRPADATLKVEQVIFPTRHQDTLKFSRDTQTRGIYLDETYAAGTPRQLAPHVWAYAISASVPTTNGEVDLNYMVDGETGTILQKRNGAEFASTPARATGNKSQYSGTVALDTVKQADLTYRLGDVTRPIKVWPYYSPTTHKYNLEMAEPGAYVVRYNAAKNGYLHFSKGLVNGPWGDGLPFDPLTGDLTSVNGETAAVDAMFAFQGTWDYMKNMFGRNGIDNLGSGTVMVVHAPDPTWGTAYWFNAAWTQAKFNIMIGDSKLTQGTGSLACPDVIAHEFAHGVNGTSAKLDYYAGESGGLNESNSDILGVTAAFYMAAGGTGTTLTAPTDLTKWTIGAPLDPNGEPFRYMYKPSLDGYSWDSWFDGVGWDDVHFSSGPNNRMFYFLSMGASKDSTQPTYSPYLPGGMTGIGAEKAVKIWYRALTTKVTDTKSPYQAIYPAMVSAAVELYGTGSAEVQAVQNAYAAINVCGAVGAPNPIRVSFGAFSGEIIAAPMLMPVPLRSTITNATNPAVTYETCGWMDPYMYPAAGTVNGNMYTAPTAVTGSPAVIKVTSVQDPRQYALGRMIICNLDADYDNELDACDMGLIALNYLDKMYPNRGADVSNNGKVDSNDVSIYLNAFKTVFGK